MLLYAVIDRDLPMYRTPQYTYHPPPLHLDEERKGRALSGNRSL